MHVGSPQNRFGRWSRGAILAFLIALTAPSAGSAAEMEFWSMEMQQGDTISSIARRYLKNPNDWHKLQQFNQVRLNRALPVGTRINIPVAWLRMPLINSQVIATRGTVRIERGGTDLPAAAGTEIKAGDRLSAGEDSSMTLKFPDGSTSSLHANTRARIEVLRVAPPNDLIALRLRLDAGRIEHAVTPRSKPASSFEVATPVAVIGARGTRFRTSVDDTSRGEVLEGRIEALGSGSPAPILVGAGSATIIPASGVPSLPIALLPPPDLSANPSLQELKRPAFSFDAIAGAGQYRALVASDAAFTRLVAEILSTTTLLRLPEVPDGNYFLRVRGIDANRLEGREDQFSFSVKAASPPPPEAALPAHDSKLPDNSNVILSWLPEKLAASYRFELAADNRFDRVLHASQRTILLFATRLLPPGRYFWRLASNRGDGEPGPWGPVMQFSVEAAPVVAPGEVIPLTK